MPKFLTVATLGILSCGSVFALVPDDWTILMRGDANNDDVVDLSDAVYIGSFLFSSGPEPPCLNQADANNDGDVDVSDQVYLLQWFYQGGPAPPSPGPYNTECTDDDEPYPGCEQDPCN